MLDAALACNMSRYLTPLGKFNDMGTLHLNLSDSNIVPVRGLIREGHDIYTNVAIRSIDIDKRDILTLKYSKVKDVQVGMREEMELSLYGLSIS